MIFKKDNFYWGLLLGTIAPILGMILFKYVKFKIFSFKEVIQFMMVEPGFRTLSVGLSLSLLLNAALFTVGAAYLERYQPKGQYAHYRG